MKRKNLTFRFKGLLLAGMWVLSIGLFAQGTTVSGTVLDSKSDPIIRATVKLESSNTVGTITDVHGKYVLKNVKSDDILVFNYVGMQTKKVSVNGRTTINVVMQEDKSLLDEYVVVGYGTRKRVNLTGAVNTIKPEMIVGKSVSSLTTALQGTTPGVTVISRPGDLGKDMGSINVRGRGNLGSSSPMFVVDGVLVSEGYFQRIHPGDIESISILKDAAAASIYGSRAAFGVFLVTTKKGKKGSAKVNYNGYYGMQSPTILPRKLGSYDYATLLNEANQNAGKNIVYDDATMQRIKNGNEPDLFPNNNWYDMVLRSSAPIQEHNINISGGGETRYYVSGTFFKQNSLVPDRDLNRYNIRANTERDFTKKLKLGTNISFIKDDWSRQGNFSITDLDRMTPLTVARQSNGNWGTVTGGNESGVLAESNPLRKMAEYGRASRETSRFNGSINATFKPIESLAINGIISYDKYDEKYHQFDNKVTELIGFISNKPLKGTSQPQNKLEENWSSSSTFMTQLFANYNKTFGKNDFSLMAGTQFETFRYEVLSATRKEFPDNRLDVLNAGSATPVNMSNGGYVNERAFLSQFGRINYSYSGKYLFEANVRFDQSSQFPENSRLGIFPSFSGAWRMSEEEFMKNLTWVNNLKLRASWGKLGNVSNVGYYDYYDTLLTGSEFMMNGVRQDGVWPSKEPNKNLSWETVSMTNFGVDASFFKNKFDIQLDLYNKVTSDILLIMPKPLELGLGAGESSTVNAGVVTNNGVEFTANYRDNIGDFNYQISGNFSKVWNKITDLNGLDDQVSEVWIYRVGESIGSFYGYKANGLFANEDDVKNHVKQDAQTKPGDIKYEDVNGDGVFNAKDRTILGNDVPYFTYGLSLSASYKGFDLSIQGQGVNDVKVYLSGETSQAFYNGASAKEFHFDRWTKENPNPNANYPRILPSADNTHNTRTSSFWLFDADYFRVKNVILGYNVPNIFTKRVGIDKVRLYLSASNIFTIRADKRLKDFDPEMPSARGTYPNLKVVSLGLNLTF